MIGQVLLIGLGDIGFQYDLTQPMNIVQTHARAFSLNPDFELVAGVDPVEENRSKFYDAYSVQCFNEITSACKALQPNVVVIASPTCHHLDNLKEVISCCKPDVIVMEKPAAYTKNQAQQMLDISMSSAVPVLVNLIRRADPAIQEIKHLFEKGEIETPCKGVVWYSKGIVHSACHFIDLLSWWLGDIISVERMDRGREVNEWDIEADLRICFGESSIYFLSKKSKEFNHYNIELLAKNGRLTIGQGDIRVGWQAGSKNHAGLETTVREIKNEFHQYQTNVVEDIALYLRKKKSSLPSLEEHVEALSLVYELIESWKRK